MIRHRVLVTLRTNLPAPSVFAAFEDGVKAAQDYLSIPIRADIVSDGGGDAYAESPAYEAYCCVALLYISGDEEEARRVIVEAIDQGTQCAPSAVLLVAAPGTTFDAAHYFASRVAAPRPSIVALEGVADMDRFMQVVEDQVVTTARRHLPAAQTIDKMQEAALGAPIVANARTSTKGVIHRRSLS